MVGDLAGRFVLQRRKKNVFQRGVHLAYFPVVLLVVSADVEELQRTVPIGGETVFLVKFIHAWTRKTRWSNEKNCNYCKYTHTQELLELTVHSLKYIRTNKIRTYKTVTDLNDFLLYLDEQREDGLHGLEHVVPRPFPRLLQLARVFSLFEGRQNVPQRLLRLRQSQRMLRHRLRLEKHRGRNCLFFSRWGFVMVLFINLLCIVSLFIHNRYGINSFRLGYVLLLSPNSN